LEQPGEPPVLVRRGTGYALEVRPEQVDAERARRLLEQAQRALDDGDPVSAIAPLQDAEALWRGPALADLADYPFSAPHAARLTELHLEVLKARVQADLALGRHRECIGDLRLLVAQNPLDEGVRRALVIALYRDGRPDDATAVLREGLDALHDRGLDSAVLERLQEDVLRGAASLAWTPPRSLARTGPPAPTNLGMYQLPPDIEEFTGRMRTQAALRAALTDPAALARGPVVVAFAGKAGAGKTALAVHVAHQVRENFPDQALYVDLRGNQPVPLTSYRALCRFAQALGVNRAAIPDDPDDLAELYREQLANRRVLLLLDNAAGEAQIRPLLPASPGCAVIVTSRSRMHGLAVRYWMVDVLHPDDAVELLGKVIGAERVAAEPAAARDIAGLCGYLPLAVQIAGRKLAAHPHWRLERLAARLANERDRLSWLEAGDLEVRASFALSYTGRPADEQRAFRLLALLNTVDFAPWVAAAVLDADIDEAEDILDRLTDAQLLERAGVDRAGVERHRFHDLLRVFAREQVGSAAGSGGPADGAPEDGGPGTDYATPNGSAPGADGSSGQAPRGQAPGEHREALSRLLGAYIALLRTATETFTPGGPGAVAPATAPGGPKAARSWRSRAAGGPGPGVAVWELPDRAAQAALVAKPLTWFGVERSNIHTLIEQAHDYGLDEFAWRLAVEATEFYAFTARFTDWDQTHTLALEAARRAGNRLAEAALSASLAERDIILAFEDAFWRLDAKGFDPDGTAAVEESGVAHDLLVDAAERLTRCRETFAELGDTVGEARCLHALADVARGRGHFEDALGYFDASLELLRTTSAPRLEAEALVCLAMCHGDRDELDDGITCLSASLAIARELDNKPIVAYALRRLGDLYRHHGRHKRALASYNESLKLLRELPDAIWEPRILVRRGEVLAQLDDHPGALRSWQQAVTLLRQSDSNELAAAEARLSGAAAEAPAEFSGARLLGTFDQEYFIGRVAASRRVVRMLNTWTDLIGSEHADSFAEAVTSAVASGAMVQVLLLDPDCPHALQRAEDLHRRVDVPAVIRMNLRWFDELRGRLPAGLRTRLAVRIYDEQPLTAYHRWDTGAFVATFPVGYSSSAVSQHEVTVASSLVSFMEQRFDNLWSSEHSISLDDYFRLVLQPATGEDRPHHIDARFVRLDGSVYAAMPDEERAGAADGSHGLLADLLTSGRHPAGQPRRCRLVPLRDATEPIETAFESKYGTEPGQLYLIMAVRPAAGSVRR
jgi:tetratricopeptide (TPR) repeat protein